MSKSRIVIVDDEMLIKSSLQLLIDAQPDMTVVGTAEDGQAALGVIRQTKPDLVLMDVQMPIMDGILCIRQLRKQGYDGSILILTTFNEEQYIIEGLANGANGYLLKGHDFAMLLQTLRSALLGEYYLPTEVAAKLVQFIHNKDASLRHDTMSSFAEAHSLSKRELEVFHMLLNRMDNAEIAAKLYMATGTVKNYLTSIYQKLDVKNRREAIQYFNEYR